MIIDTNLHDDIFRLEREYETAKAETNAALFDITLSRVIRAASTLDIDLNQFARG